MSCEKESCCEYPLENILRNMIGKNVMLILNKQAVDFERGGFVVGTLVTVHDGVAEILAKEKQQTMQVFIEVRHVVQIGTPKEQLIQTPQIVV